MIKIIILFTLVLISACSLNSSSALWTKNKKVELEKKLNITKINLKTKILKNEINPNIKIKNDFVGKEDLVSLNLSNNNGLTIFDGELKKVSKYNFSKIKYFDQYDPELSLYDNNLIFFDNKGSILNFNQKYKLVWKKNYYSKTEKKKNPILFFSNNSDLLIVADTLAKYYAIDLKTGNLIWTKKNNSPFNSQIKILNDKFYIVDDSNILNCFNLKDGKKIWSYKTEKTLIKSQKRISIVIKDNKIIFNNTLGDITALNNLSGTLLWQTPTQSKSISQDAMFLKISDLILADDSVLFSNNKNEFYSLDISTGMLNWKQLVNSSLRPVRVNDFVFSITEEGFLVIIDFKTGSIIRSTDLFKRIKEKKRNKIRAIGFVVGKKKIYLSTSIGRLFVINIENGNTDSIIKLDNEKISTPIGSQKNLFIVKNNSIIKLN